VLWKKLKSPVQRFVALCYKLVLAPLFWVLTGKGENTAPSTFYRLGEDGIFYGGIVSISRLVVYVVICKVGFEGRVQHGVWYEVREAEPTAGVKN